jgi:hypothetical protein
MQDVSVTAAIAVITVIRVKEPIMLAFLVEGRLGEPFIDLPQI